MIDENEAISIRRQCDLLNIWRSGVYYKVGNTSEDTDLANEIHDIWQELPFYGYRRITAELHRREMFVNHKKVRRIMKESGIEALYPKPNTRLKSMQPPVYPYLLRDMAISSPNQVWATDITYIRLPGGFVYLIAMIDIASRYILSWRISNSMDIVFCLELLEEALIIAVPSIINTDQGSQFTSQLWVGRVGQAGIKVSMDGVGRWADNIFIERFWRTLKHECLRYVRPETLPELRSIVKDFVLLYNNRRLHQSLNYRTPNEVYKQSVGP